MRCHRSHQRCGHLSLLHLMHSTSFSEPLSSLCSISFLLSYRISQIRKEQQHFRESKFSLGEDSSLIMSLIEMASAGKFRYQKLRPETGFDDGEIRERSLVVRPKNKWYRFRRIHIRRRFKVKVPSLRRLWRKKAMMVSAMRRSCAKVMKRLKEGQVHFGDLFAGNYLFMQINPTSLAYLEREITLSKIA